MKKFKIYLMALAITIVGCNYSKDKSDVYLEKIIFSNEIVDINKKSIIIKEDNAYKIVDMESKKIKKSKYDYIKRVSKKLYVLGREESRSVYNIDLDREITVENIFSLGNNYYLVLADGKFGVIDENLKVKVAINKDVIVSNGGYNFLITEGEEKYLLDENFDKINIDGKFENLDLELKDYIYILNNDKYGILDFKSQLKVEPKYERLVNLNDKDLLIGYLDGKSYFINLSLGIEKEIEYDNYGQESERKIMVLKDGKLGYIDEYGNQVTEIIYDGAFSFKEGKDFIQVKEDGKWKIKDVKSGKVSILPYDDMGEFTDGFMVVSKDDKYGYIDHNSKEKIKLEYTIAENFENGVAIVAKETGFGLINKKGKVVIPTIYDQVVVVGERVFVKQNNKMGIFNKEGKEIVPIEYDYLGMQDGEFVSYIENKVSGVIRMGAEKNGN